MIKTVSKALIKNRAGAYLLLYRGDSHPNFPGHLDIPGGEVEPNESYKEATAREIWEETGVHVQSNSLEELFAKQYKNVKHILFEANIDEIDIPVKLSWEHKNYCWMTREELLNTAVPNNADLYYVDVILFRCLAYPTLSLTTEYLALCVFRNNKVYFLIYLDLPI